MTNIYQEAFGALHGGRVLDVATGNGGFIQVLLDSLGGYTEIVGIDSTERVLASARQTFQRDNIRFAQMNAEQMNFADASFDTVCISNSLHHMANLPQVLAEMKRVLRPAGHFVINEMYRDGQTETQLSHVHLHHWWAAVDTAQGVTHHETFTRQQIADIAGQLGLHAIAFYDYASLEDDPKGADLIKELDGIIDRSIERTSGAPNEAVLRARGEELRQRVHTVGFHSATALVIVGEKSSPECKL